MGEMEQEMEEREIVAVRQWAFSQLAALAINGMGAASEAEADRLARWVLTGKGENADGHAA